jgi:hypothetical protein
MTPKATPMPKPSTTTAAIVKKPARSVRLKMRYVNVVLRVFIGGMKRAEDPCRSSRP